jgi:hypothetical protein
MRNVKTVVLVALTVSLFAPAVLAATFNVSVAVTGDNFISGWYQNGTGLIQLPLTGDPANWQVAKTGTSSGLQYNTPYSLIWQVVNDDAAGGYRAPSARNPGGFLAQVTGPFGTILSSASGGTWTYATQPNTVLSPTSYAAFNVNSLFLGFQDPSFNWLPVAGYGLNSGGGSIWSRNISGGSVPDIDPNAEWIWDQSNFDAAGAPGMETSVFIKYTFDSPDPVPAPEPSLILLLGLGTGAVGTLWSRRKR